ncbi:MAG TPA: VCBS repeat-containing protein, partial [Gemmatales bacterium]|nr:VCBS repeat-containing protein [Gemmatales bacterium]
MRNMFVILLSQLFAPCLLAQGLAFKMQEVDRTLQVGYCVVIADVNSDQKPDIVIADAQRVIWLENPTWKLRTILQGQTKPDNVSLAARDIDGDGQVDFALAADWRGVSNTRTGGTLQWLKRGKSLEEPWQMIPIADDIPTIHRIRFAQLMESTRPELLVVPLMGRGTSAEKNWSERGVEIQTFSIPAQPERDRWPRLVMDQSLLVVHNFEPVKLLTPKHQQLLLASYDGLFLMRRYEEAGLLSWRMQKLGEGDQSQPQKSRGCSE